MRLCEKNQPLNPPRRTGQVYADLRRKKTQIRRMSQKDLLNLRDKKNVYFIQNVDTPQQTLCVSASLREKPNPLPSRCIPPRIRRPNLENRLACRAQATVMPFSIDDLEVKAKACAHTRIVSREKGDGLHVFSSFRAVSTSTCTRKFAGFRVKRYPLKSSSTENFDRSSCSRDRTLNLLLSLPACNHPVAGQVILGIRDSLPDLNQRTSWRGSSQGE